MDSKVKIGVVTTAVALGCAGVTYFFLKHRSRVRDAVEVFNYLTIETVRTDGECNRIVGQLRQKCAKIKALGFDCEWVTENGRRRPVALLQLSSHDGLCGLFRLSCLQAVPASLKELLEDESIYKVGIAPLDDARYLLNDYSVQVNSTLDLRHLAVLSGHKPGGLANLSVSHLGIVLDKSWRVRCSDWEANELTHRQTNYAAADAHVAVKLFLTILKQLDGICWPWWHSHKSDVWANTDKLCKLYVDRSFKAKQGVGSKKCKQGSSKDVVVSSKRYAHATRSKPLYQNCFLEAPDGELLCTCDSKKAQWYVDKGLASTVSQEPLTVRLLFEPAGRSVGTVGRYYQIAKENKCVVCAADRSYIRKNVVPREYRKHFPEVMKDHSSHDVVLLCASCHQRSNMLDASVRARLAAQCGAPLKMEGDNSRLIEDAELKKVRSAARALLHQSNKLPEARKMELEGIVLCHYPTYDRVTAELLERAANVQVAFENADYESHGGKVVEYYQAHEGLLALEELWREHFLATMRPRHLPPLWSVKHNEERLRVRFDEGRLSQDDIKLLGLTKWIGT